MSAWDLDKEYERIGRLREQGLISLYELNEMRAKARAIEARRRQREEVRDQLRKDLKGSLA